jgi:hypothetical protein
MLIAKGLEVSFRLVGGSEVFASKTFGMLHDPSGSSWPSNSVLIAPYSKGGGPIEDADAESYFGHQPKEGKVELPPLELKKWKSFGEVDRVDYTRRRPEGLPGIYQDDYRHEFNGQEGMFGFLFYVFPAPLPELFKLGRLMRLEMPFGSELNERGFVFP